MYKCFEQKRRMEGYYVFGMILLSTVSVMGYPSNLRATYVNDQIEVRWNLPPEYTYSEISRYILNISIDSGSPISKYVYNTYYYVPVNGKYGTYEFKVIAIYIWGSYSRWSPKFQILVERRSTVTISTPRSRSTTFKTSSVPTSAATEAALAIPNVEQDKEPIVGMSHNLKCNAGLNNVFSYIWKINNQIFEQGLNGIYTVNGDTLSIRSITKADKATTFQCRVAISERESEFSPVFYLKPRYGPEDVILIPSNISYTLDENQTLSVNCMADCYPECSIEWKHRSKDEKRFWYFSSNNKLLINKVRWYNAGVFRCLATSPNFESRQQDFRLNVNYGPNSIKLFPSSTEYDVTEKESFGPINCSADCYPKCSVKWRFKPIGGKRKTFQDSNILHISNLNRSHTGNYRCLAESQWNIKTAGVNIVVHYGPANATLEPDNEHISVEEGGTIRGIKCSAECGTRCTFIWTHNNSVGVLYGDTFYKPYIYDRDDGVYQCVVKNDHSQLIVKSKQFRLDVLHGPKSINVGWRKGKIFRTLTIDKRKSVGLINCTADCKPNCNYTWDIPFVQNVLIGSSINLGLATKNHDGSYSCTAANEYGFKKYNFTLIVNEYGIKIHNTGEFISSPYYIAEGSQLILECKPKCKYNWCYYIWLLPSLSKIKPNNSPKLHFKAVSRYDSGNITCYDFYQRNQQRVQLIVKYQPSITDLILRNKFNKPYTFNEIKEGENLEIECLIDSVPKANVTWKKAKGYEVVLIESHTTNTVFTTVNSTCEDSGTYICEINNGIGNTVTRNISVKVRCPPRLRSRKRKIQTSTFLRDTNSDVNFTVNAIGYPPLVARWFYMYNVSSQKIEITATNKTNITHLNDKYSLYLKLLDEDSFGLYFLELHNEEGNVTFNFSLKPKAFTSSHVVTKSENGTEYGQIIGSIIAGIALLALVVITLVAVIRHREKRSLKEPNPPEPDGLSRDSSDQLGNDNTYSEISTVDKKRSFMPQTDKLEMAAYGNCTYETASKNSKSGSSQRPSDVKVPSRHSYTYAEVQKPKNGTDGFEVLPATGGLNGPMDYTYASVMKKTEKNGNSKGENNNDKSSNKIKSSVGKKKILKKKDELNYVDLDLVSPRKESNTFTVHGAEDKTTYSMVDFTKHADPLPDSDEEQDQEE